MHRIHRAIVAGTLAACLAGCSGDPVARHKAFLENGDRYVADGKLREAVIEYRNAVDLDPKNGASRAKLAETYERLGDGPNALQEYIRAADLLPDDTRIQLHVGKYLLAAGRTADALARADAVIARNKDDVDAHILRGTALGGLNDLDSAINAIEEAVRIDPTKGASYTSLGMVQLARGSAAEAEAAFKKAVELSPRSVDSNLALANFYWASGRLPESERSLQAALSIDARHRVANRAMALFLLSTQRISEAEPYLKQLADSTGDPFAAFGLIDYYIATGRTKEAKTRLEPLVAQAATAQAANRRLAQARAVEGDKSGAHTILDGMIKANPRDAETQLFKGQLLVQEGRRDEALPHVQAAITAAPSSASAQFALGKIYASRGDVPAAEAAFRETIRLNPRATAAQVALSQLQLASGGIQASLQSAEEAARREPRNLTVRLALVRSLIANRQTDRAAKEIDMLLAQRPNDAAVHVQQGLLMSTRNNLSGARAAFTKALTLSSNDLEALAGLVAIDVNARDFAAARKRVDEAIGSNPKAPALRLLAGRVSVMAGDAPAAEKLLREAIELDPPQLIAYGMLAQLYVSQGRLDQARVEFDALAQRQARPVSALTMSGIILQGQGKNDLARERFERALAVDANAAIAGNNLAWMDIESGQLDTALQRAQAAAAAAPDVPEIMDTLGWAYYKKNLSTLAIPLFIRAIEKSPKNASYHYHAGMAYVAAGDAVRARSSLEQALKLQADFAGADDARQALAKLAVAR
jgi:putative PEP-CTERM system TPR-repeat lipoprotein